MPLSKAAPFQPAQCYASILKANTHLSLCADDGTLLVLLCLLHLQKYNHISSLLSLLRASEMQAIYCQTPL